MNQLYETIPTMDFKQNPAAAFKRAEAGPIVVMSRATPAAVMVSPDMWNATARKMSKLEAIVEAMIASRQDDEPTVSLDALCERLGIDPYEMAKGGKS